MAFTDRPLVVRAAAIADADLDESPLAPDQLLGDAPEVRVLPLHESDDLLVGVWQHGVGESTDVEADEVFVVLSGRATIEFDDAESIDCGPIDCGPGDVVMLPAGARTRWTVHETLRKIYVIRPDSAS